ncbi:uncharacterized protein [Gossypium hirsutum]|uniref:CCHC-type domain-containing protein n=1 Tax=Gossypium hirsutum TaxID=3635 RepID=A0A1U8J1D3_GOSHI|nr:uncharacterized protein LOC107902498 [Gossypium hirsutum]
MATEYEHCVWFKDGLRDSLRVLIAPQREWDLSALVKKAKIAKKVKRTKRQNRDRWKAKRDVEPSNSGMRPRKKARSNGPVRVGLTVAPTEVTICKYSNRRHPNECWRATGACLRCGSTMHRVKDCPLRANQMQAPVNETVQPPRVVQQPPSGRGQARGGNGMGRGQRTPSQGTGLTEVRQPTVVYAACHREGQDAPDVITNLGSTHSYVASTVSETLGILIKNTDNELTMISPLGQSV